MKKLLMLILIGLLLALSIFIAIKGFEIGNVEVLSYIGIQERNKELDEKIQQSSKLAEKDYKQAVNAVQESSKKLEQEKKEYENITAISSEGDVQTVNQIEKYEVETLWVKLGNYATSEGAIIRIDIVKGANAASDMYDLKFTVNGSYISITDFISDIENDSTLGFKIEEFKMLPGQNSDLQATFVCKDIAIKDVSETSNPNTGIPEELNNTVNTTNTTNTTNSVNTTNSTNTTNEATTNETTTNTSANNTNVAQ